MKRISYETAKLAFEKGYLEYDETFYNKHGNLVTEHNYSLGIIPDFDCSAPYQAELQQWLREEHGIAVLVTLDETLSYYWIIVPLHPKSSIQESKVAQEIWCGQYEDCLESGLQATLKML